MIKEDELLIAEIEDKYRQSQDKNMVVNTGFLDGRECALVLRTFKNFKYELYGGYEDAERRVVLILPDYVETVTEDYNPLALLRITVPRSAGALSHRDYLGSILALGINRSVIGDIIVSQHGADIVILKSIAEFLLANYKQAGHTELNCEILPVSKLDVGTPVLKEKSDTVASLRLDNIVASIFNLSRSKAQTAITSGIVYKNNLQCIKPDAPVSVGDKIVLRGRGKAVLKEIGYVTKKGRQAIKLDIYV